MRRSFFNITTKNINKIKTLLVVLPLLLVIGSCNSASALDISQQSLSLSGKSDTAIVHDAGIGNLSITPTLEFNRLNDYVSYNLVIKNNDGKKYKIVSITDDNTNEAIAITYNYSTELNTDDKSIDFTIKYVKTTQSPLKSINVTIKLVDEDDASEEIPIIIPNTGTNTALDTVSAATIQSAIIYIIFAAASCCVYIIVRRKKTKQDSKANLKTSKIILTLTLLIGLVPVAVIATEYEDLRFIINLTNVQLNGPYTITFDTKGGSEIPPQIVNNGETVTKPSPDPVKNGYDFDGWVDENGDPYDFDTPVTGPVTLSASWKKVTYTISYDLSGGTAGTPANPTSYTIETPNITLTNPTKEHYNFTGWTGTDLTDPAIEVIIAQGSTGNRTYTATWTEKEYTVTYDSDGGTSVPSETKKYNEAFTEPSAPEKTGYNFVAWQLNGVDYDFNTPATSDITLKATWEKKEYTVSFNSNGGSNVPSQTVKYQEVATAPTDPTKTKFEFVEWQLNGTAYDFSTPVEDNITLDAVWIELFTITFNSDGGSAVDSQTVKDGETISKPHNPEKTGYNFIKWQDSEGNEYNFSSPVNSDFTLTAVWEKKDYIVTFNSDGGTEVASQTVKYQELATEPQAPEKTGYDFVKWQLNGTDYNFSTPVEDNITLTAVWEKKEYTVTFNSNGGSAVTEQKVKYQEFATKPQDPTRTKFEFVEWQLNGTAYDFSTPVEDNITLDAVWIELFTVNFNSDGGSAVDSQTVKDGETITKPHDPEKTGYNFVEWQDTSGNEYDFTSPVTTDFTLKAVWEKKEYTVTFNSNGGSAVAEQKVKYQEFATKPQDPTKTGYNFVEWQLNNTAYNFDTPVTGDITLKAVWEKKEYTVSFNSDGGSAVTEQKVKYQEFATKPQDPEKTGYNFKEWQLNGSAYDFANTPVEEDITLTAIWEVVEYTITYNLNGGSVDPANPDTYTVESNLITLTNPTREHYTFTGWTGTDLTEPTSEVTIAQGTTGDRTYTANWTPVDYSITYNLDGGSVTPANPTTYNIETATFTLNNPEKTDYVFKGWTGTDLTDPTDEVIITQGSTGDRTYTANWNELFTVTYDVNGGEAVSPTTFKVENGETIGTLTTTTREHYNFDGWYIDDTKIESDYVVTSDITITAKWTPVDYTITYNLDGGSVDPANPTTYNIETATFTLNNPTKEYYTFIGWTGSNGDTPETTVEITQGTTDNLEYNANWTPTDYSITYNLDGGSATPANPTTYNIETNTFTLNNPTKTGFEFDGWTGTDLTDLTKNVTITQGSTGDRTYTANWTELFTVTFNANGGTPTPSSQTVRDGEYVTEPEAPTRNGYEFKGWQLNDVDYDFANTPVTANIELKAKWEIIEYTIHYDLNGGTVSTPNPTTYTINDTFTLNNPTLTGHNFKGWSDSDGHNPQMNVAIPVGTTGNLHFIAHWAGLATVEYDPNGGDELDPASKELEEGDPIGTLPTPTRNGYNFVGWYVDGDTTETIIDENYIVNDDIVIVAKWTPTPYTITYNLDGGTAGTPANPTTYNIETATFTLTNPTKAGYDFDGWTGSNGTTPQTTVTINQGTTGDLTYDANWTELFTVTFNANGGTSTPSATVRDGDTVAEPTAPTRTGYNFLKWQLNGADYNFSTPVTADITLDAVWEAIEYTITYDLAGGTAGTPANPTSYTIESSNITLTNPTKEHYDFTGWTGTDLTEPTSQVTIAQGSTGNRTYAANWTEKKYTVTYDPDGGTSVPSETKKYNETFTEPTAPTKTGYNFVEWQLNGTAYDFDTPVTGDITLKAVWEAIEYTISYNLNGATTDPGNPTTYTIETPTITLTNPSKTKHVFKGWTGSNGTTPEITVTIPQGSTGNKTYEANWNELFTVTYDPDGGTMVSPLTFIVEDGEPIGSLANPSRTHYAFDGWYIGTTKIESTYVVTSDITITAKWTPVDYTITYNLDGGSATNPTTYNIETATFVLNNPTKTGYDFDGWTGSNGTTPETTVTITQGTTGDLTYTANWTELFTVTFDADGGSPTPSAQTIRDGETATEPTTEPEKTDYVFNYWMDSNGDEFDFTTTPITGNITLTAKWQVGRSTLNFDGPTLVTKMKQIANPSITISDGYNYPDTVTKSFKRASEEQYNAIKDQLTSDNLVSTSSSLAATYMWFDDTTGTMYYYTEAEKVEVTGSMAKMFSKYDNLTDLSGLADFDVSSVTNMDRLFQASKSLNNDSLKSLADWDTSSVKNMSWIFGAGNSSEGLQITSVQSLSGWDVSSVISFQQAFKNAVKLVSLDGMEKWNVSSVGYDASIPSSNSSSADNLAFSQMFNGCTSLTDASAIVGWDITNAVNSALANGKTKRWAFDKMLQNAPALASQPAFTEVSGSWQITAAGGINAGTYKPD